MASTVCTDVGKSAWPELVGIRGNIAKNRIERENPRITAAIALQGSPITLEINCSRVRVWVNRNRFVVSVPTVG